MKRFIYLLALLVTVTMQASVVTYTPDNTTIFRNPERGFTDELNGRVTETSPYRIKNHIDSNWGKKDYMTMPVVLYNFGLYKDKDLPDAILNGFDEDMQELRNFGLKCVLRFAYTERESDIVDATPDWVKRHLEQLKPHLAANADVIYVLEAGFVGVWGEWYYSQNYGNETQHVTANRRKVIEYLFANAPVDRFILFRYQMIQAEYLGDSEPLTTKEGFSGTEKARMGFHNDAFLNTWGDMGTYASSNNSDDPKVRQYIATSTLYVPNGGETNIEENAYAEKRYSAASEEMSKYHWSFCGSTYAAPVTRRWRDNGIFDTLNIHMGYRYNLVDGQFTDQAAPAGKMNVTIRLRNDGYAPLYNARTAYIVLKNGSKSYNLPLQSDPRRWLPNGVMSAINEQLSIPADMPEGTYHLYLYLPDKYESIAADPKYAIRIANKDMWDGDTGLNDLGASVTIASSAPLDPGELPEVVIDALPATRTDASFRPRKVMESGTLYIVDANGVRYTANGQIVK